MRSFIVLFLMALASPEAPDAPSTPAASNVATETPSTALGLLEERTETVYYDVHGRTPYALASSLATHGPEHNGERYFGMTEWEVRASYGRRVEAGTCRLTDVAVHLDVDISLPRWRNGAEEDGLRIEWDAFVHALDEHEHGHRALAVEAADTIRQRLVTLRADDCRTLWRKAETTMIAVMADYDERHRAYDLFTNHGYTQGVVWPRASEDWHLAGISTPVAAH